MIDFAELRRHPRVNVELFADWGWGPECEYYDKITSLSVSGCFLATKRELPFGVFLAPAALIALLWGDAIIAWYLRISGL